MGVPLLWWAAVWGYALGIGVLRLLRWLPGHPLLLNFGWILAIVPLLAGLQVLVEGTFSSDALLAALTFEPVAEYVAIAFVGTPLAQPFTIGTQAVLSVLVVSTPIGLVVATHQATVYWFTDSATATASRTERASGGFSPPPPFQWTLTGRMAWGHLLRARRQPQEIGHVPHLFFPVAIYLGIFLPNVVTELGTFLAGFSVVVGTHLAGTAFTLNPLGDDRPSFHYTF